MEVAKADLSGLSTTEGTSNSQTSVPAPGDLIYHKIRPTVAMVVVELRDVEGLNYTAKVRLYNAITGVYDYMEFSSIELQLEQDKL